jgi:hypothetical protein
MQGTRTMTAFLGAGVLLLGAVACSDDDASTSDESSTTTSAPNDGSTLLATGVDVELVGEDGLAGQTLNIDAREEDGTATGEFAITENVHRILCADTDTEGYILLGGEVTAGGDFEGLQALIIREGDPDGVSLYANDAGAESCEELLESIPDELLTDDSEFVDVEAGSDIQT